MLFRSLASGDAVVAHNYSGDVLTAAAEVPQIRYLIPREGSIVWTDNMAADASALVKQGWKPEASLLSPEEGWGRFCYLQPPSGGLRLELVSTEIKELMESRWA